MSPPFKRLLLHLVALLAACSTAGAQSAGGRIVSEHVWVRVAVEREWIARDSIVELEECWRYVKGVTGEVPRRIQVDVAWDSLETRANPVEGTISIGFASPAARSAPRAYLTHSVARTIAEFGLYHLSRGASAREEMRSLTEGMSEILAHEFAHSGRALNGAWVLARMIDRMQPLTVASLSDWKTVSQGRRDLRAAAPGITFLLTCLEQHGRERTLKLFDALRRGTLEAAALAAFKARLETLEEAWLAKVRSYPLDEELTVTTAEEAPARRKGPSPAPSTRRGGLLDLRMQIDDLAADLAPTSVFVMDETSGRVSTGQIAGDRAARTVRLELPIEAAREPGSYGYRTFAVDEAGNMRSWKGTYTVTP
jgi:hypothetical protein